jgi:hypothetical protein
VAAVGVVAGGVVPESEPEFPPQAHIIVPDKSNKVSIVPPVRISPPRVLQV